MQFTTLALLVFRLTGSGLGVSGVVLAEIAPVLLLAPMAGPLVDRLPRVSADLVRVALAGVLAVSHGNIAVVYGVAFGLSAGSVFFDRAAGALLPTLVEHDELVAANSGIWSAAVLSQVALAPLAGLLVATVGFAPAFAVNAASFAISALLLVDLVLASLRSLPTALGALFIYGIGTSTGSVTFSSVIQSYVPDRTRGRVFAAFDLIWQAMRLASLIAGGLLADAYGIRVVYYIGGLLLLAAALSGATAWGVGTPDDCPARLTTRVTRDSKP